MLMSVYFVTFEDAYRMDQYAYHSRIYELHFDKTNYTQLLICTTINYMLSFQTKKDYRFYGKNVETSIFSTVISIIQPRISLTIQEISFILIQHTGKLSIHVYTDRTCLRICRPQKWITYVSQVARFTIWVPVWFAACLWIFVII